MDKLFIIKIGGNIVDDESALADFLASFAAIDAAKILVHGGGKLATRMAEAMGIQQQMIDGRRVTDAATLKIVTMVYAGYINKNITAILHKNSCNAIGICGTDANAILTHKRNHTATDYGFVGDIDQVNSSFFQQLISNKLTPVVAPITHDGNGQLLNTNADTIAQALATALSSFFATTLVYTFEKQGVLLDTNDENSVIPLITPTYYEEIKAKNLIFAGMIPKLDNAFEALNNGVSKVVIGKADQLIHLLNGQSGTTITHE